MKKILLWAILTCPLFTVAGTNNPGIKPSVGSPFDLRPYYKFVEEGPADPDINLFGAVTETVTKRGQIASLSRFGYANDFDIIRAQFEKRYNSLEYFHRQGANMFLRIIRDTARIHTTRGLSVDGIANAIILQEGPLLSIFDGSVGNIGEERQDAVSVYSATESQFDYLWKNSFQKNGVIAYGIRPFNSQPYVYATFGLGHLEGRPVTWNIRLRSDFDNSGLDMLKIEQTVFVHLAKRANIAIGLSLYPTQVSDSDHGLSASVRFERLVGAKFDKYWSIGASSNSRETVVLVAFSKAL